LTVINTAISVFLVISVLYFIKRGADLNRQRQILTEVGEELEETLIVLKETTTKKKSPVKGAEMLTEPHMLSTIITVLVKKHGQIRITAKDLMGLDNDDYVSVYVDIENQDLILALKNSASPESTIDDSLLFDLFSADTDDNTFH